MQYFFLLFSHENQSKFIGQQGLTSYFSNLTVDNFWPVWVPIARLAQSLIPMLCLNLFSTLATLLLIISGLFGSALEADIATGDGEQVLNRIANSVVNPKPQWLQPDKSDDKGMP